MKTRTRFYGCLLLLIFLALVSVPAARATGSPLAGTWRVILFSTPSSVTMFKDGNGRVTGINQGATFEYGSGRVTVDSSGNFTGTFSSNGETPENLTGTMAFTSHGKVTVSVTGDTEAPIAASINASLDFMISHRSLGDVHDAMFFLKEPAAVNANDLEGGWLGFGFETPSEIKSLPSNQPATSVTGLDKFSAFPGNLTVGSSGTFAGFLDGAFTGSYSSYSNGELSLNINADEEGPFTETFSINASKTVMMQIKHHADNKSNELLVFVRQPSATPDEGDMVGHWKLGFLGAPGVMTPIMNSGFVVDLNGKNEFEIAAEKMTFGQDGAFTAQFVDGPETGTITSVSTAGSIDLFFLQEFETATVQLSSSLDIFFALSDESTHQEMIFGVKSPPPNGTPEESGLIFFYDGSQFQIYWAAQADRLLQESTDLVTWTNVPDTQGTGTYTPANGGNKYYRIATSPQ
ncbi:MAG TPA: hypothetical protein VGH19_22775 [Verrucomicrobiae bacterium]